MRASSVVAILALAACAPPRPPQEVRCVFIDAGAHRGQSYTAFQQSGLYASYDWEIFAIEANPHIIDDLPKAPRLTVIPKAVWTEAATLEFNLVSDTSGSNSLYDPQVAQPVTTVQVDAFDFSSWLNENLADEDVVILSMDIEAAEFPVLNKMLEDRSHRKIDRLYVEVHPWLLDKPFNEASVEARTLLNEYRRRGVAVVEDSVEDAMKAGLWLDFLMAPAVRPPES